MRREMIFMILGMALLTFIPRAIPAVLMDKMKINKKAEKFLKLIPYTAMSALIFPSIFLIDTAHPQIGIVGGIVAILLAWKKMPIIVCILAAVLADFILYLFI